MGHPPSEGWNGFNSRGQIVLIYNMQLNVGSTPISGNPRVALTVKAEVVVPKSGTEKQADKYRVGRCHCPVTSGTTKNVEPFSKVPSLYNARILEPCKYKERQLISAFQREYLLVNGEMTELAYVSSSNGEFSGFDSQFPYQN